jgi:Holliday junction resolvase RusA-like endonuclease
MRQKQYLLPIPPIAWKRVALNGKRFFDAQAMDKMKIAQYLAVQHGKEPLFDGPLEFTITFYFPIPASRRKKLQEDEWMIERPDYDNCAKFIADTIKNVIITDDKRICRAIEEKRYSKNPRTEFTIRELE